MKNWHIVSLGSIAVLVLIGLNLSFKESTPEIVAPEINSTAPLQNKPVSSYKKSITDEPDFIPKKFNGVEQAPFADDKTSGKDYLEQYDSAKQKFENASPDEQKRTRLNALDKILSGETLDPIHQVAIQHDWERNGRIQPNTQFTPKQKTSIDVNGMEMDLSFTPDYVTTQVMVYVTNDGFVKELGQLGSIKSITEPFANLSANPSQVNQRDIRKWRKVELTIPANDIERVSKVLTTFDEVSIAEPVVERKITGVPVADIDDTKYLDQWHLDAANVKTAWASLESENLPAGGADDIVVAVIDSGVDYTHPDLVNNMWRNPGEIPNNNVDDDGNGFVDDVFGVDVLSQPSNHNGDPQDVHGHGTHVAGIIAAEAGNSQGVVGVAYNTKIMAIKAAQFSGILTSADVAEAILYAVEHGADVINMSFGGYGRSQVEEDALATAYSQAVLISSAGNDGKPNQYKCKGAPSYPASYPWVVGVMATQERPNEGGYLTNFSNRDCVADNGIEYEVMAPGAQIWSTLPNNSYGAWNGTSMAAPVVSGVAALARTKWPDKSQYSSRFIMGQIATTGDFERAYVTPEGKQIAYRESNANLAVTTTPAPLITLEDTYIFDKTSVSTINDEDGRVDAGETIELAISLRNRWGKADNVQVTISTPNASFSSDPNVNITTDSINYGAIGSFNVDDNGFVYEEELITGVSSPFVFKVLSTTPNNHRIPFTVTITARNGFDDSDSTVYEFEESFTYDVQKGRQLPNRITSDIAGTAGGNLDTDGVEDGIVTLDDSSLWIVDQNVLVDDDVTLKFVDGAYVQFWSSQPDTPQTPLQPAFIRVEGRLEVESDPTNRVVFKPSTLFPYHAVQLRTAGQGEILFDGVDIENYTHQGGQNTGANITLFKNSILRQRSVETNINWYNLPLTKFVSQYWGYDFLGLNDNKRSTGNQFYKVGNVAPWQGEINTDDNYRLDLENIYGSLIDNSSFTGTNINNTVMLNNVVENLKGGVSGSEVKGFSGFRLSTSNALEYEGNSYIVMNIPSSMVESKNELGESIFDVIQSETGAVFFAPSSNEELRAVVTSDIMPSGYFHLNAIYDDEKKSFKWANSDLEWEGTVGMDGYTLAYKSFIPNENSVRYLSFVDTGTYLFFYGPTSYRNNFVFKVPGTIDSSFSSGLDKVEKQFTYKSFKNNAVLTNYNELDANKWISIQMPVNGGVNDNDDTFIDIANNYWGTTQTRLIEEQILDVNDNFSLAEAIYQPILNTPSENTYPFVVDVEILDSSNNEPSDKKYGVGESTWRVSFNRDMDQTKQPVVTFGPETPFTDFQIGGAWVDARTWEGNFNFSPVTGDGLQKIRVIGAVAADNPAMVTGDDKERFQFELITSGVEALTMQASGGERDQVTLSWTQDDFELLNGYNVYRSMSEDGNYVRVNSTTLNKDVTSIVDTEVTPGEPHYYYFTVMTGRSESTPSNIAMAVPLDTIAPEVSHIPKTVVQADNSLPIRATITDNIQITSAKVFYRQIGSNDWIERDMVNPSGNLYVLTLNSSELGEQGIEYYINATDGDSSTLSASESAPYTVTVALASELDSDGDGYSNAVDLFPFSHSEWADYDLDGIGDNSDTDDDNDLVLDDDDAFPNNANEYLDTDEDGIGNNTDQDDDNDGTDDSLDRFPLDERGASDRDLDGMPDEWEDANGLDKSNRFDAYNDDDLDGITNLDEFVQQSDPQVAINNMQQVVFIEEQVLNRSTNNIIPILYTTQNDIPLTTGLGLRIHVKRSQVEEISIANALNLDLIAYDIVLRDEQDNEDNNPNTDAYLSIAWASQAGTWPGLLERKLFDLSLSINEQTRETDMIHIDFSIITNDLRYRFAKQSYQFEQSSGVMLDIDNNGQVDALTDGLLLLRYMFGFTGETLSSSVIAINGVRTDSLVIAQYMDDNRDQFDVDGDGRVDALTDGVMLLRYMFGFTGNALITNNVVSSGATRKTAAEIELYLASRSGK